MRRLYDEGDFGSAPGGPEHSSGRVRSCNVKTQHLSSGGPSSGFIMAYPWTRTPKPATVIAMSEAPSTVGSRIPEQRVESVAPIPGGGADSVAGRGRSGLWAGLAALVLSALLVALYAGILRDLAWQWWDDSNYT